MRDVPLLDRKRQLAKLLGKVKQVIHFNEHLTHDGATVFQHACRMGLEGIVSKRLDAQHCMESELLLVRQFDNAADATCPDCAGQSY